MKVILVGGSKELKNLLKEAIKKLDGDGTLFERIYVEEKDE